MSYTNRKVTALPSIMKYCTTLILFVCTTLCFSQNERFTIDWDAQVTRVEGTLESTVHLEQQSDGSWLYVDQWKINGPINPQATKLTNVTYKPVPAKFKLDVKKIPTNIEVVFTSSKARDDYYAILELSPFVLRNGQAMMVTGGVVDLVYGRDSGTAFAKAQSTRNNVPAIGSSLLASGDYYKFYVEETGVHRITRNFMESLGISLNGIDPSRIKVFGYGGSPLPLRNSDNTFF